MKSNEEGTTTTTEAGTPEVAKVKEPSKKSRALAIFAEQMELRKTGKFASNKEFRAAVLTGIQTELGVSVASAATMYNAAKKEAEAADASVALGRDPKKEKVKNPNARRGRPAGSGKKKTEEGKTEGAPTVGVENAPTEVSTTATEPATGETPAESTGDQEAQA